MKKLILLPAIDVSDGKAVRLVQGELGTETAYGSPVDAALSFQEQGAEWIHLVDLDAAFGKGNNKDLLKEVIGKVDINVELSGGIRDDESLENALAIGAQRINLGTAALEDPDWTAKVIAKYQDKIAIGLDVRGRKLAARGWTKEGGELLSTLERLDKDNAARYVVTDVTKDGTLQGPNVALLKEILDHTKKPIIASGGISSLQDIETLRQLVVNGVEGAIVGKALYAQKFNLVQALLVANGEK
jgi:1-(5-phosphoribosyl)-5-[(5-phosphoribosylamino)methylideneamino] imidazole-4-carboxamide isomerase/N-(5'phosphoribosyl)anthranilate isomerase